MKWLGTFLAIIGSLLLSLNIEYSKFGYVFFFFSSTLWSVVAFRAKDNALFTLNIFFTVVNSIGMYRWIL